MDTREGTALQGKKIAVLMTDGVEQVEYTGPREFLEQNGAKVTLISPKKKGEQVQGFNHQTPADKFTVEMNVQGCQGRRLRRAGPSGRRRQSRRAAPQQGIDRLHQGLRASDKPIAAICHGPWTLIDAGVAKGKRMTSWPSCRPTSRTQARNGATSRWSSTASS